MTDSEKPPLSTAEKPAAHHDIRRLRRHIRRFSKLPERRLDHAICDVIDRRGYALAALLRELPRLPLPVQKRVAMRVEDVLFFHPHRGVKVFSRLVGAVVHADPSVRLHLIAAVADVLGKTRRHLSVPHQVALIALDVLQANTDAMRRSKAVEILSHTGHVAGIPAIVRLLIDGVEQIGVYEQFHFTETALFALKRLGGEGLLRLLINPQSTDALQQFRMEWRNRSPEGAQALLALLRKQDDHFAQMLLKVIDLAEFSVPFAAMVTEGLQHGEKWIRQAATASLVRITDKHGLEHLQRMLRDPSLEVRMMAVNSMGGFEAAQTGKALYQIAGNEGEHADCRMNALYSLFSQKNRGMLERLGRESGGSVAVNAKGLGCLLMPREDGLEVLIGLIGNTPLALAHELHHYLMEISRPEDLKKLVGLFGNLPPGHHRESFLTFLTAFLHNKSGAALDRYVCELSPSERAAVLALRAPLFPQ
jgi:hypothetical protein